MRTIAAAGFFVLGLAGKAAADPGVTPTEVTIGVCTALDGFNKQASQDVTDGARAYIDYVNAEQKGAAGRQIKLLFANDAYDPVRATECFNTLLSSGAFAQAFVNGAPTAAKYIKLSEANQLPLVGFLSGAPFLYDPFRKYAFPSRSSFNDEAKGLVEEIVNGLGAKKVSMIYQADAFGASCLQGVMSALQKAGLELASSSSFDRGSTDVSIPIESLKAGNPEVVLMAGNPLSLAEILKKMNQPGGPRFIQMVGREEMVNQAGDAAEGVILSWPFPSLFEEKVPAVTLYSKAMAKYRPDGRKNSVSFDGFIQAMILVEGLNRTGKDLTRERFVAAMETIQNWDAGLGAAFKVNFRPERHDVVNKYTTVIVKNKKLETLTDWKALKKP